MAETFLPYGRQVIDDDDIAEVVRVLRSDYLTTGPEVPAFEKAFAAAVGVKHAISCSNGTAALHLLAVAAGLGPGTTAIVPTLTFLATANAVRLAGGEVVFADVDQRTGCMTAQTLEDAVSRSTGPVGAVFPVHLGGWVCDMPGIRAIAERIGAAVFEDACHAIGSRYTENGCTSAVGACAHSKAATFSLHPVKTIAAGEGGVVTTNDDALASRVALLRSHGMVREPERFMQKEEAFSASGQLNGWYYEMPEPGFNYRLTDIQAALARSQLSKLDAFVERRAALAGFYRHLLRDLSPAIVPVPETPGCRPGLHLFQVAIDFLAIGQGRAALMDRLRAGRVGSQVHYFPVHRQPYYRARYPGLSLPGADRFYEATLSLPLFASMTERDVERVVDTLHAAISR